MSILRSVIEWTRRFEELSNVTNALEDLASANGAVEVGAAASKLAAEMAVGGLVAVHVRTILPAVRLGLAISGNIWKWEALTWAAGATTGIGAGAVIDAINELHIGGRIYDWTHSDPLINNSFNSSTITQTRRLFGEARYSSPLILDLDGNGVVSTRGVGEGAYFDHDGNGLAEQSGWVGAGDALLVRDLNGNGRIDGGAELFGNQTELSPGVDAAHGFAALGALDSNGDGKVNAQDSAWSSLRLWKDANGNGITDDGELIGLGDAGVSSLGVAHTTSTQTDAQGNQHRQLGSFTRSDGSSGAMHDVWFATDAVHHREVDPVAVNTAIAALPDMQGLGNVHSLRQAMARDTTEHLALFDQFGARSTTGFANRIARDYSF